MTVPLTAYPANTRDLEFVPGDGLPSVVLEGTRFDDQIVFDAVKAKADEYGFAIRVGQAVTSGKAGGPYVRVDVEQLFTTAEQARVRQAIGVSATGDDLPTLDEIEAVGGTDDDIALLQSMLDTAGGTTSPGNTAFGDAVAAAIIFGGD